MSAGKLKITIISEWEVEDLEDYEAGTLEEAAENTENWLKSGDHDLTDYINADSVFVVEVVKDSHE